MNEIVGTILRANSLGVFICTGLDERARILNDGLARISPLTYPQRGWMEITAAT